MKAREGTLKSATFGDTTRSLFPVIEHGGSDSSAFDNVMEFIAMDGERTLPEGALVYYSYINTPVHHSIPSVL